MIPAKPTLEYRAAEDDRRAAHSKIGETLRRAGAMLMMVIFACLFLGFACASIFLLLVSMGEKNLSGGLLALGIAGVAAVCFAIAVAFDRSRG